LFDIEPFSICGRLQDSRTAELWAQNAQGSLAMEAVVTLRDDIRLVYPEVGGRLSRSPPERVAPRRSA